MEYIKQNFVDGAVLNAEELNHIEDGIVQIAEEVANLNIPTIDTENIAMKSDLATLSNDLQEEMLKASGNYRWDGGETVEDENGNYPYIGELLVITETDDHQIKRCGGLDRENFNQYIATISREWGIKWFDLNYDYEPPHVCYLDEEAYLGDILAGHDILRVNDNHTSTILAVNYSNCTVFYLDEDGTVKTAQAL